MPRSPTASPVARFSGLLPPGLYEDRPAAVQLAADVGAEQPHLAGALRLVQEHVAVHGQPVGGQGVAVGIDEDGLGAVQLAADVGAGQLHLTDALCLVQEHATVDGQPVGARASPSGLVKVASVQTSRPLMWAPSSVTCASALRRVGTCRPSTVSPSAFRALPVGLGSVGLAAVQLAADAGAEQPHLSGAPRLVQEQVAVHGQPVGDQGLPSGIAR